MYLMILKESIIMDIHSFHIWNYDNINVNLCTGVPYDLFVDEQNGDVLNDAVSCLSCCCQLPFSITLG